jgi:ketosteroid isomerase-like protein
MLFHSDGYANVIPANGPGTLPCRRHRNTGDSSTSDTVSHRHENLSFMPGGFIGFHEQQLHHFKDHPMSVTRNKALIDKYFELMNEGNPEKMLACLTDDFVFESMLQKPAALNFSWGKEQFAKASGVMSSQMKKPIKIWIVNMTGEDDKVAVEAKSYGEMNSGKLYENAYHFLFKLRTGKIYNCREYSCSYTAHDCFGAL